ncbi:hypothetical protein EHYA_01652 [Embleya hyalina]|uniref:Uncharacterized protein n=1 Tax=Embleya hyalina TaxID=516124 RepID=A0A401YH93_9ACTN|nr:hypothetical protein EHYA_01652 [Embleya hyalina]
MPGGLDPTIRPVRRCRPLFDPAPRERTPGGPNPTARPVRRCRPVFADQRTRLVGSLKPRSPARRRRLTLDPDRPRTGYPQPKRDSRRRHPAPSGTRARRTRPDRPLCPPLQAGFRRATRSPRRKPQAPEPPHAGGGPPHGPNRPRTGHPRPETQRAPKTPGPLGNARPAHPAPTGLDPPPPTHPTHPTSPHPPTWPPAPRTRGPRSVKTPAPTAAGLCPSVHELVMGAFDVVFEGSLVVALGDRGRPTGWIDYHNRSSSAKFDELVNGWYRRFP